MKIEDLILQYLNKDITAEEQAVLDSWLAQSDANRRFFEQITDESVLRKKLNLFHTIETSVKKQIGEKAILQINSFNNE